MAPGKGEPMQVHDFLQQSARRFPDKTALVCDGRRLSYLELNDLADRCALGLAARGINRQDRVIIYLDNSIESIIAFFGILKAGAIFIMLNPGMKAGKLNFILKDSGARAIICQAARLPIVNEAAHNAPELKQIIFVEDQDGDMESEPAAAPSAKETLPFSALLEALGGEPGRLPRSIDVDLATIIYTSGSTGEPKGVMSAHSNVVAAARSITSYLGNVEDDIILNTLPLSFDYGLYQALMASLCSATLILEQSFAFPYRTLELLGKERVTGFPVVPTMVALMMQLDNLAGLDFSSLRYITNTAAALPVSYIEKLAAIFPSARIFSMYGLTECKRVAYMPPEELWRRPTSVGIPIPNEEVFIVDEHGRETGPDTVGELVVRGANVMQGYWNRPEETATTFRPGKYRGEALLYTGDLFKRDRDGFLYFVARKDDLIKTRGERVSPREVENALCAMPGIAEAAVIGVPDEILGQAIMAFVVPLADREISADQVKQFCTRQLEPFMVPKHVRFATSLPRSASGKVDKKPLKAGDWAGLRD